MNENKQKALVAFAVLFDFYSTMLTEQERSVVKVCVEGLTSAQNEDEAVMALMGLESIFTNEVIERLWS